MGQAKGCMTVRHALNAKDMALSLLKKKWMTAMTLMNKLPSLEDVKKQIWYDTQSGVFRSRTGYKHHKPWRIVGNKETKGYLQIKIGKSLYMAHRLAWLYATGEDPISYGMQVDHIDNNKTNNTFTNLRLVTNKQNCENRTLNSRNKTGHRGIYKRGDSFVAEVCHNYKRIKVGSFATLEDACQAVEQKRKQLFTHSEEKTA